MTLTVADAVSERVERERQAVDESELVKHVKGLRTRFRHVFLCPAVLEAERRRERLLAGLIPDAVVMDYGCYDGGHEFWRWGSKRLVGVDISDTAIAEANRLYGDKGEFLVADAHDLSRFPDGSFDLVVGNGILHHLDLRLAIPEVSRLLRPGGSAVFLEPLGDNPLAKLFRRLTPKARTADERPLSRADITAADALFSQSRHDFCSLLSTPAAGLTSLLPMRPDNLLLRACARIDAGLCRTPLKWWARSVYLHWVK